ncbi:MAG: hypothetical protein LBJ31_06100 [Treponema sp.]|jgi:outer membrane protein assembly factor BamA|nr:hypothetical protein [Treponema sp.]
MYKKQAALLCMCITLLCVREAAAEETVFAEEISGPAATEAAAAGDSITKIEIIGLKRTKEHIALYPLERFRGTSARDLDENEVKAVIMDTGILDPVSVEVLIGDDGAVLRVTVTEKWSIIPLPLFSVQGSSYAGGIFLADTNAFGLRDQAVIGGMYGSSNWMLMSMYNHVSSGNLPGWTVSFGYTRGERKDLDSEETVLRRFKEQNLMAGGSINYSLARYITAAFGVTYGQSKILETKNLLAAPDDARFLEFAPRISVRTSKYDGYLMSEKRASLSYEYHWGIKGDSFGSVRFDGQFQHSLYPGFLVSVQSGALWSPDAPDLFESGPEASRTGLLPAGYRAQSYAGFSAGLEKYLLKFKIGTLSALAAWQTVVSKGPLSDTEAAYGPIGGIRFYLSRIAIPGLSFAIGYNIKTGIKQFSFNMGVSL